MIWVSRLGAASVAGVGIAGIAVTLMNSARSAFTSGQRALIARFFGAGDREGANNANRQAFVLSIGFAIVVAAIGIFFTEPILRVFGVEPDVVRQGAAYMRINFIGMVGMSLRMFTEGSMQASGDTMRPMKIGLIFRAFHIALCPFLVFGWWIFPRMGVAGAALTDVFSAGLGAGIGLWFLSSGRTRLRLTLRNFRLDPNIIWRMMKIGIPSSFMSMQHQLSISTFYWLLAPFGTLAVAGHTLWQRIDQLLLIMGTGMGTAAGVAGGQNLGAKQPERAKKSGWLAAGFITVIMFIGSLVLLLWAEGIASIFSTEPGLVKMASSYLRISAASYIGLGLNTMFMNFLTGVGDTLASLLGELTQTWGVQVPLAFFLSRSTSLGVYGVRWGMAGGFIFAGVIFTLYFWLGKWKHKRV
jgi:putative MATE family efflux protein